MIHNEAVKVIQKQEYQLQCLSHIQLKQTRILNLWYRLDSKHQKHKQRVNVF